MEKDITFSEFLRLALIKAGFYLINEFEEKRLALIAKNGTPSVSTVPRIYVASQKELYDFMYKFWNEYKNVLPVLQELHFNIAGGMPSYSRELYDAMESLDIIEKKTVNPRQYRMWIGMPPLHEADSIRIRTMKIFDGDSNKINAFCKLANQLAKNALILEAIPATNIPIHKT